MKELESITEETLVDPKELNQLIARLSNPSGNTPDGSVRIKDIAETLELNEEDIIRELARLRESKKEHIVPMQSEKLAEALQSLRTPSYHTVTNAPLKRTTTAAVIMVTLLFAAIMAVALLLSSVRRASFDVPTSTVERVPTIEQPAPPESKAPVTKKAP